MADRTRTSLRQSALAGTALALIACGGAFAQEKVEFNIEAQEMGRALNEFGIQSGKEVYYLEADIAGRRVDGLEGTYSPEEAIRLLLEDTGIQYQDNGAGTILVGETYARQTRLREEGPRSFRVAQAAPQDRVREIGPRIDDAGDDEDYDTIIVTGTNIRGVQNPTSPVFVYDREDIQLTGAATAQDFIRTLPQNLDASETAAGGLTGPDTGFAGSAAGVNIRGLGRSATLTLINGRRVASGGGGGAFVDISLIPLSAIERVEVLTDGASAIYGADAVAGVVNFILRDDYDGVESQIRAGTATEGRGSPKEFQASQTVGKAWAAGNVMASYEYYRRNSLESNDRPFSEGADDPTDLLPNLQRHSVLINARREVAERLELFATGSFSSKEARLRLTGDSLGGRQTSNSDEKLFSGNVSAQYVFPNDWRVSLSGGFSRNEAGTIGTQNGAFDRDIDTAFNIWTADFVSDGKLFQAPGGAARFAIGGQFRTEKFDRSLVFTTSTSGFVIDREVYAVFGELVLPIIGDDNRAPGLYALDVTAAGRFEDFSDVGSSTNPKVGLRYAPVEGLNFRGTYSTAFQAPDFFDLGVPRSLGPLPGSFVAPPPGSVAPAPPLLIAAGGNPDLGPETSRNYTIGVDYSPVFARNVEFSLTYFDINFEDRVGRPGPSIVLTYIAPEAFGESLVLNPDIAFVNALFNDPGFTNFFGIAPEEIGAFVDISLQNLASTKVRGFDIGFNYIEETPVGSISFDFNGSYLLDFIDRTSDVSEPVQVLDTAGNPVDFRFRSSLAWTNRGYGATLAVTYVDDYASFETGVEASVDAWTTVDLNLSYDASFDFANSVFNNTRFNLNIRNLFDEDPPFVDQNLGVGVDFDGANASPLGRYIALSVTKAW